MIKGWEVKKLGDVCEFVRGPFGGSLKKNIFKSEGYAVYEQKHAIYDQFDDIRYFIDENKFNDMKRFELNSGDLIMSCSGTMGKMAIVPENIKKGIINQALLKLTPSKDISIVFLKLWMQSESFQDSLKAYSQGAAIQNVASVKILKEIEIPLPPLPEQKRIVAILDEGFESIAKAKENAEKNLKNAKEIFESYLQSVFENKGEGWEERTLGEITTKIGSGATPRGGNKSYKTEGISLIRSMNVHDRYFKEKNLAFIDEDQANNLSNVTLQEDDVLFNITGASVTRCCIIPAEYLPARVNQHVSIIRPKPEIMDSSYLNLLLTSEYYKDQLLFTGDQGATRQAITKVQLQEFVINYPLLKEQQAIVTKLDALSDETKKLEAIYEKKLSDLEELKKSILQKAFDGELK
ncbi:MAG: type I restriction enzyme, S subunit [Candidatus Methanocomedens sp.]|nr:MAG: type I restriction enzyme, S subunit [ANME-2 cluster archaeon]